MSAYLDCFIISVSDISIFERSSKVKPDTKVVLLYEPLPALTVSASRLLGDLDLLALLLLLLETLDLLILLIERIVYSSFSKFI